MGDVPCCIVLWRGPSAHDWSAKVFPGRLGFLASAYAKEQAEREWVECVVVYRAEFPEWIKVPVGAETTGQGL